MDKCEGCFYYKFIEPGVRCCHFMIIEDEKRGSSIEECTRRIELSSEEAAKKNRKYYNELMKIK